MSQVICERGSKLNKDTLAIMPYADATIKEALRLGAVINIVPKRALKTFEIGGYTIPKVLPYCLHVTSLLDDIGMSFLSSCDIVLLAGAMMSMLYTYVCHAQSADQDKACTVPCY